MNNEQRLAKAVDIALQVIGLQQSDLNYLKVAFFALRDSVASGKLPLQFDDAQKQVLSDLRESGQKLDELRPLLDEQIAIVRPLSQAPPKTKSAAKRRVSKLKSKTR